jgi:alpha-ketoglutarate-dependent taurine dioxygenase
LIPQANAVSFAAKTGKKSIMQAQLLNHEVSNPFGLDDDSAYQAWRDRKLALYPVDKKDLLIDVTDPASPTADEISRLTQACRHYNFVIYRTNPTIPVNKETLRRFGHTVGLERLDAHLYAGEEAISEIHATSDRRQGEYIPYTHERIRWHTDGYYNQSDQQIRGFILHCVSQGATGGENMLLDHEMAYLILRDENPDYIRALMQEDAITIPANVVEGEVLREAVSGPVFSVNPKDGSLHMRYSARQRNIIWKNDPDTTAAAKRLQMLWEEPCEYVVHHRLEAGQGVLSNNVLHGREAFEDQPDEGIQRLLLRARYYDRIVGTASGGA